VLGFDRDLSVVRAIVVAPGPCATTEPSLRTRATPGFSLDHAGLVPTRIAPALSVIVAARCSVSPIAVAVSTTGRTPTQATPRLPMVWCDSDLPTTPKE